MTRFIFSTDENINKMNKSYGQKLKDEINLNFLLNELANEYKIHFTYVKGQYKGHDEFSILVTLRDNFHYEEIRAIIKAQAFAIFNQESILEIDENNNARLIFNDGTHENIGKFTQVKRKDLKKYDGFTQIYNKFYTCL